MPNMLVAKEVRDTCYKNRGTVDKDGNPRTVVHHIDFNHDNNDPKNLIFLSKQEHNTLHGKMRKGCKRSEETKQKISASGKGRAPWNKGKTDYTVNRVNGIGWHHSDEARDRISKNNKSGTAEVRAKAAISIQKFNSERRLAWKQYKSQHDKATWNEFQTYYRNLSKQRHS